MLFDMQRLPHSLAAPYLREKGRDELATNGSIKDGRRREADALSHKKEQGGKGLGKSV
jgi:hypothetical protein